MPTRIVIRMGELFEGKRGFAAGLLAGAVAVAVLAWALIGRDHPAASEAPLPASLASAAPTSSAPAAAAAQPPGPMPVVAAAPPVTGPCSFDPVVPAAGERDGQFNLETVAGDLRPNAFVAVAREAAADGRRRDAEVAFIAACRLASRAAPAPSVPVGDVLGLLGQHYGTIAADASLEEVRHELQARAHMLLEGSAQSYTAVLGANAAKSRTASQRLAAFNRSEERAFEGEAQPAFQVADPQPEAREASFAQLDADLQRLQAQAAAVSGDRDGVQRRAQQAEAKRDACRDRACLQRWYAQRRAELLAEF